MSPIPTLEEVTERLIDAMALSPAQRPDWLEIAEHRLTAHRARLVSQRFRRMYDVSTVGARMRTAREVCGMSQTQASIRIGVSANSYRDWELGRRNMAADRLRTVSLVLGVRERWLLEGGDEGGPAVPREQLRKRITQHWKDRQTYLAAKKKARAEVARLNGQYRARKRQRNEITKP